MDETENTVRDSAPPSVIEPEPVLAGRYKLRGILGRGGMGTVYRAEDMELREIIALKIVSKGTASDAEGIERQRDEVRLARRVTHPNVARTFDLGEHEGTRFITMELVDGPSLRELLAANLPLAERIVLVAQIASGLAAIHEASIAHRDLKPDNVLVSSAGIAKITDFGIARAASSLASGMTTGTPRYMAPEVLAGDRPTMASDVYAFGLVAHEVLTGDRLSETDLRAAERELAALLGTSRAATTALLVQCLAVDPGARPVSVKPIASLLAAERAGSVAMGTIVEQRPRARLGAALFATIEADGWLADSVPLEMLRSLGRSALLEVTASLLPLHATLADAAAARLDAIIVGEVRREADGRLTLSTRALAAREEIPLFAQTIVVEEDALGPTLRETAALIASALTGGQRLPSAPTEPDPRVTELVLRAAHADNDPWRQLNSQAGPLLEQAVALAPDDARVHAALAFALFRGPDAFDIERFARAKWAADRAVALDSNEPDSQLALALGLFLSNEPLAAIAPLRFVMRQAPSMAEGHSLIGGIAGDVALFRDAIGRSRLTMALDPLITIARVNAAVAHEHTGEHRETDSLLDEGMRSQAPIERVFSIFTATRVAIWRGGDAEHARLLERFAGLMPTPFADALRVGFTREAPPDVVVRSLGPLANASGAWSRQRGFALEFEAELWVQAGDYTRAADAIARLVAAGSNDDAWFRFCPAVQRVHEHVDLTAARAAVFARAERVREALQKAGLIGRAEGRRAR